MNPIQEVWAIYPNQYGAQRTYEFSDHNLRLIELTPGTSNDQLIEEVKWGLTGLLERMENIYRSNHLLKS